VWHDVPALLKRLSSNEREAATATLAEAFWDDPLMEVIAPDKERRKKVAPWFFKTAVAYGLRWGEVWANDDVSAVAIWLPPGETDLTPLRMLRAGMGALPFKAGFNGTSRFMTAMSVAEKFHKGVKGPHWYLFAIGTRQSVQGTGQGSALVKLGTDKADAAGLPCYLETGTASNVAFHTKRGFEISGTEKVLGFDLWGMVRPAVAPGSADEPAAVKLTDSSVSRETLPPQPPS
jgi:hypothetical protein